MAGLNPAIHAFKPWMPDMAGHDATGAARTHTRWQACTFFARLRA
jgi:hypothetical protein